jgi:hypothetical protein
VSGATAQGYNRPDRAYHLIATHHTVTFQIDGSKNSPIYNPAFVIKNWGSEKAQARLKINHEELTPGPLFRQGMVIDTDGTYSLIIWIDYQVTERTTFEIRNHQTKLGCS